MAISDTEAMARAYGIAAVALERAMEGDMVWEAGLEVEDAQRVHASCEAIRKTLDRAANRPEPPRPA